MDTLFGIALVAGWIAISVVALKRALGSGGPSPQKTKRTYPSDHSVDCTRSPGV